MHYIYERLREAKSFKTSTHFENYINQPKTVQIELKLTNIDNYVKIVHEYIYNNGVLESDNILKIELHLHLRLIGTLYKNSTYR